MSGTADDVRLSVRMGAQKAMRTRYTRADRDSSNRRLPDGDGTNGLFSFHPLVKVVMAWILIFGLAGIGNTIG